MHHQNPWTVCGTVAKKKNYKYAAVCIGNGLEFKKLI
jgi:hypothetical protein